jgi:RNA polymerase sigma-70 factor, ECF subfamily
VTGTDGLDEWIARDYATAYRTACLVLRDPHEAQDAVQEAFLRVWRFRASVPDGDGRRAWLYRVVVNACMSRARTRTARSGRDVGDAALAGLEDLQPQPELRAEQSQLADDVVAALADLPEHLRVPLVLRFYAGLSEREIATAIDRRPGTVKSRLHEARQRLATDPRLSAWVRDDELETV